MIRIEKSEALQRKIRRDDATELAIPTWTLAREAIQTGRVDEALEFINYGCSENRMVHDSLIAWVDDLLTRLASFGEEEIVKQMRERYYPRAKDWISATPGVEETLQRCTEYQRSHFSDFTVVDEPDRYVMRCDPCGAGGRLRRTGNVGTTKKAYPWSWSRSGVPYYCIHCCIFWEIIPTELRGYPIRINLVADKPEDPCIHLYYKNPELIPEQYFTRIGKYKKIK